MTVFPAGITPLLSELAQGALVLTPNHRSSVQLHALYGQYARQQGGKSVFPSANIRAIDLWIRDCWEDWQAAGGPATTGELLLDPAHEKILWHDIVRRSAVGTSLLNIKATAMAAGEAFTRVRLWRIPEKELRSHLHFQETRDFDDLAAFLSWSGDFIAACRRQRVITQVQLLENFIPLVAANTFDLPDTILLSGFRQPPPLYANLLDALKAVRSGTRDFILPPATPAITNRALASATAELEASAAWARQVLEAEPAARIGIVCPQLATLDTEAERVFSRVFSPASTVSLAASGDRPFALSGGAPLSREPLVSAALAILDLNNDKSDTLQVCRLLRSPFIHGADTEEPARARLEQHLRRRNELLVRNADVRYFANLDKADFHAPDFAAALLALDQLRQQDGKRQRLTAAWCDLFERQLDAAGWPGTREPDAREQAALRSWQQTLARFRDLSQLAGAVNLGAAVDLLKLLLGNTRAQGNDPDLPVQVLGPVEADGQLFTHLWIMGLTEQHWPPPARLSPFIPYGVQKKYGIPEADINVWTEASRQSLQQFTGNTTGEVILSYPLQEGDIRFTPSAMLASYEGDIINPPGNGAGSGLHPLVQAQLEDATLDPVDDDLFIPLLEEEAPGGGTSLLANQAECPFRSFALHRLGADRLESLSPGLNARDAGNLLHLALQNFWTLLKSQADLLAADESTLRARIEDAVLDAVRTTSRFHPDTMSERFCFLEQQRLQELLWQWLAEERKRGSFRVVATEQRLSWRHPGLTLSLRIDRIDETDNGHLVLVDYKSSKNTAMKWQDERQSNPQLPLYLGAVAQQEGSAPVDGVYFAQVNIEECRYRGIGDSDALYPGSGVGSQKDLAEGTTWETLRRQWQESLSALADEFLAGYVAITPKSRTSCTFCHLHGFCRIQEMETS